MSQGKLLCSSTVHDRLRDTLSSGILHVSDSIRSVAVQDWPVVPGGVDVPWGCSLVWSGRRAPGIEPPASISASHFDLF